MLSVSELRANDPSEAAVAAFARGGGTARVVLAVESAGGLVSKESSTKPRVSSSSRNDELGPSGSVELSWSNGPLVLPVGPPGPEGGEPLCLELHMGAPGSGAVAVGFAALDLAICGCFNAPPGQPLQQHTSDPCRRHLVEWQRQSR